MASWTEKLLDTIFVSAARHVSQELVKEAAELNRQWGSVLMRHPTRLAASVKSPPQHQPSVTFLLQPAQQHSPATHHPLAPGSGEEQALLPLPTPASTSCSPLGDVLPAAQQHSVALQVGSNSTMPTAPSHGVWPQLTSNPLYRLGSADLTLTSDHGLHQQHRQPLHQNPASTSGDTTAALAAAAAGTAAAADSGTASVLASALLDANERVCSARAQLMSAQADINMLLGVIERQQQLLQAATQARQELTLLLAQQSAATGASPQDSNNQLHHMQTPQPCGPCQIHSWPGSASSCSTCCGDSTGSSSSTWSSSTICSRASGSTRLGSSTGGGSSSNISEGQQGGVGICSSGGTAGEWAVTVQPPGLFGARVHVSISRSRLCPGIGTAACSSSCRQSLYTGTQHGVRPVGEHDEIGERAAGPGLPSTLVHNSSFKSCSMDCSKAPAAPLLEL